MVSVEEGSITIGPIELTKEPVILYVRELEDPDAPLIFWHDWNLEILEHGPMKHTLVARNQDGYKVKCRFKIARAEGGTAQFRYYRGNWESVFSTMGPMRQVKEDRNARVSVIEVKSSPVELTGDVSRTVEGAVISLHGLR